MKVGLGHLPLAVLLAAGCGRGGEQDEPPTQAAARQAPDCGRIAFVQTVGLGPASLALISADGSGLQPYVSERSDEPANVSRFPAAVSPDGSRLLVLRSEPTPSGKTRDAFEVLGLGDGFGTAESLTLTNPVSHGRATPEGLEAALSAGKPQAVNDEPTNLDAPALAGQLRNPVWAQDGQFIVFESDANSFRDLYRLDVASHALLRLTDSEHGSFEPAISPESDRVAFVSSLSGNTEIFVMGADGATPTRLTDSPGEDTSPVWSPDGTIIAFISARERSRGLDVYLMERDGSRQRPLRAGEPDEAIIARDVAFSPDGSRLAFTQVRPGGGTTVVVFELSTGSLVFETPVEDGRIDEQPAWSPTGQSLVFSRRDDGEADLVRVTSDGSAFETLTREKGSEWLPRWVRDSSCNAM